MAVILGIDAGGTFTDGALIDAATGKVLRGTKTATLHHALQSSIRACLAAFSEEGLRDLVAVCLSTTLATNALAIHRLLSTEEHCALVYFNGGTIDQIETDVNANFGTGVQEMFIETLFNLKYQTPIIISPVAVTERLRTPSLEELLDITAAGIRCETKAQEWAGMMDWSPVEALAEVLEREGRKFFENVMTTFRDAGVDTEDPLQMIMMLKRFNPVRFEQAFHPSSFDGGAFQAFCPSQLGRQTLALRDEIVSELRARQTDLRGRRVVCASADGHSYGLMLIDGVYGALGAGREFPARRFCHRRHFRQRHVRLRQPFF